MWQDKFILKLGLEDPSKRIIIDNTGLLLTKEFTNHLSINGFDYVCANTYQSYVDAHSKETKLILSEQNNIPYYIQTKYSLTKFDLTDLPYNIDFEVLRYLTVEQRVHLLNYISAKNEHLLVNTQNATQVISLSIDYSLKTKISALYQQIEQILSTPAHYNKIIELGILWGELLYLSFKTDTIALYEVQQQIDNYSTDYILSGKLKNIFYEHYTRLKTVNHIIAYLKPKVVGKTALICFDCMGVAEWFLLKDYLYSLNFQYHEQYLCSLIPSTTLFSRNVIFSGNYNEVWEAKSNQKEEKNLSAHFPEMEVKMFREKHPLTSDILLGIDFVSILYTFFDDLAHSVHFPTNAEKTKELYFKTAEAYLNKSKLKETLQLLIKEGYTLYFCSDHGSVIAEGAGRAVEKYLIEKSSKRASYVTASPLLETLDYHQYEIPFVKDKIVLLPKGRTMFDNNGTTGITHGGITVEEIIVPFVLVSS